MIDGGSALQHVVAAVGEEATAAGPPGPVAPPAADDVARFEAALGAEQTTAALPADAVAPVHGYDPTLVIDGLDPHVVDPTGLGDKILDQVDRMRAGYQETLARIHETVAPADPQADAQLSIQDMMSVYMEVSRLTLQEELMAKVVGKSTQNMDTLLKGQ